jgi:hypothetical protein
VLTNPRYLGRQVFGRQAKTDELLDPDHPALGHITRQRWQDRGEWVTSAEVTHEALADEVTWHRVQQMIASSTQRHGTTAKVRAASPRSTPGRYPLVGLIVCGHCAHKMQAHTARGLQFYRCRLDAGYPVGPAGHPPNLYVREDRLLPHLDAWLSDLFSPKRMIEVARSVVEADARSHREEPAVTHARATVVECQRKLDRHLAALEAGMDPAVIAARTAEVQRQRAAAQAVLATAPPAPKELTIDQVTETLTALHEVPDLLASADPTDRAGLYQALGVSLAYRRSESIEEVKLLVSLGVGLRRVGGGT